MKHVPKHSRQASYRSRVDCSGAIEPQRSAHVSRDTGESLSVAREARDTCESLWLAQEATHFGIEQIDLISRTIHFDQQARELWWLEPDEPVTQELLVSRIHPDDRAPAQLAIHRATDPSGKGCYAAEYRLLHPTERRERWTRSWGRTRFEGGRAARLVVIVQDVTNRKLDEAALQAVDRREQFRASLTEGLRALTDAAHIQSVATRMLGQHLGVNRIAYGVVDGGHATIVNEYRDGVGSIVGRHRLRDDSQLMRCLCSSHLVAISDSRSHGSDSGPSGSPWPGSVRAYVTVPLMHNGRPVAFLCIHQSSPREWTHGELMLVEEVAERIWTADERARAERAAREAMNRLEEEGRHKDQFLAVLSHELRNPLTPIKNGLYLLERTAPGGEKARRAQEVIGRQVDHLCHLVDGLLEINRITRGTIHLHRKQLELTSLVRGTVEDYRSVYESAGVSLEAELPPNPIVLCADASRITQIIGNLLQNAAKFTSPGGRVSIAVSRDTASGQAVIRVSDTGLGMDEKMLARVFEPFKQADTTLDRRQGGLGLGLAHAKGLVELHDGTLEANSAGPGRGAEFTVRLPLDSQPLSERDGRPDPTVTRRRVLVIEDNLDAANSLRDVLELENQEVAVAHSGREGLEKARLFRPDVVLCDIGLPEMDGYEVARAIHADPSLSGVALVALSGYARPEDLGRAANAGFQRHLAKPPNMEQLERLLASLRPGENSLSGRA